MYKFIIYNMTSPIPDNVKNKELYRKAKQKANEKYGSKTSAYKSMYIVKAYKDMSGTYTGTKQTSKGTTKWNQEKWVNVNAYLKGKTVKCGETQKNKHACRPTKKIDSKTPITIQQVIKKHGKAAVKEAVQQKSTNASANRLNWNTLKVS